MQQSLIYVQRPPVTAESVIAVIQQELKEEQSHEAYDNAINFRGELLRKLIKKIELANGVQNKL